MRQGTPATATALGRRIRKERTRLGMTLDEVEQKCGVSKASLSLIETGRQRDVMVSTVEKIAGGLGVSLGKLMGT